MQKNIIIILIIFVGIGVYNFAFSQEKRDLSYRAGEKLKYQIYYGPFAGGKVFITVEQSYFEGKEVLHVKATGYTTGIVDKLFRVYDIYESYIDPNTGLPVKAIRNVSEGNYRSYNEVVFERDSGLVISQRSGKVEVPKGIMDMVSAVYKLRDTLRVANFQPRDTIAVNTYFSDKLFPVKIWYKGKDDVKIRLGKFNAVKFYPVSKPGKLFRGDDDIAVWISNDGNFVPLRVKLNMWVGAVKIDLIEYEGLRY